MHECAGKTPLTEGDKSLNGGEKPPSEGNTLTGHKRSQIGHVTSDWR